MLTTPMFSGLYRNGSFSLPVPATGAVEPPWLKFRRSVIARSIAAMMRDSGAESLFDANTLSA